MRVGRCVRVWCVYISVCSVSLCVCGLGEEKGRKGC